MTQNVATEHSEYRWQMFRNRFAKNLKSRRLWAQKYHVEAFRIYDRDIPEFPLIIDAYGCSLVVHVVPREHSGIGCPDMVPERIVETCIQVAECDADQIYFRQRTRQKGNSQYERTAAAGSEVCVSENHLSFIVNLSDYLDTGLFLDHRDTRALIRRWANRKSFLNLFSYTGAFSVYAAAGGATETTSVDLSKTYLLWTARNFRQNGMTSANNHLVQAESFRFLNDSIRKRKRFDLVVVDPPTFSNSKRFDTTFDVRRDHPELLTRAITVLNPGGFVVFSTNSRTFRLRTEELKGISVRDITEKTIPFDFRQKPSHRCWLMAPTDSSDVLAKLM